MIRILSLFATSLLLCAGMPAQTQLLGPWTVAAPDSATLVSGGGSNWAWLSVVNTPVTVNDAFSGLPLDDDGFANAEVGTSVEVVFLAGVTNSPGDDIVLFDGQFDEGEYVISSEYDGYIATVAVSTVGASPVSIKRYYYNGSGPYSADIAGVAVDLSAIGVPAGATVHKIRFTSTNTACDPIGLGRIVTGPLLSVSPLPLVAGLPGTLTVSGATPSSTVGFAFSKAGPGPHGVPVGACGVLILSMSPPITLITLKTTSAAGTASITGLVPASFSGSLLFMQAVDVAACKSTNMAIAPVL